MYIYIDIYIDVNIEIQRFMYVDIVGYQIGIHQFCAALSVSIRAFRRSTGFGVNQRSPFGGVDHYLSTEKVL